MKYYKLYEDMDQEGNIMCYSMQDDMMTLQTFCVGKKYDAWDGSFSFCYDESEGNRETDFLANDKGWFIVSEKLREILEQMTTEIQFLPIKIIEKKSKLQLRNYYIANILKLVDALCLEKSEYFEVDVKAIGKIYTVVKYGIYAEKTEKSDVFKLISRQEIPIFVSEHFKNVVEEREITGISFSEIRVYENE